MLHIFILQAQFMKRLTRNLPTVASWWYYDTVAARLVVELSPLRVRWNGTCFHTDSGTLLGVPTASDRRWKLIFFLRRKWTISALEAWRDALYKSTTTTTTTTVPLLLLLLLKKHSQDTSVLSFLLHWLTVSRVRAANIVRRPCSDSSHVTAPYKLSFYYCYYY